MLDARILLVALVSAIGFQAHAIKPVGDAPVAPSADTIRVMCMLKYDPGFDNSPYCQYIRAQAAQRAREAAKDPAVRQAEETAAISTKLNEFKKRIQPSEIVWERSMNVTSGPAVVLRVRDQICEVNALPMPVQCLQAAD